MPPHDRTNRLIADLARDGPANAAGLIPLIYDELRELARQHLARERPDHTLQPTALVHEVWLRMADADAVDWRGRAQFLALASGQIRRILVDHARKKLAEKRGGGVYKMTLDEAMIPQAQSEIDVLALHEALDRLAARSPRQAQIVELRFFGGLHVAETAAVLGVSETTVKDDWAVARAWLHRALAGGNAT
ncbi:MAG: ECF-type sigma factor [Phycisphaerae bacterium]|nr:ECF-type sigma factor [Phycisphaerae bacterium]